MACCSPRAAFVWVGLAMASGSGAALGQRSSGARGATCPGRVPRRRQIDAGSVYAAAEHDRSSVEF